LPRRARRQRRAHRAAAEAAVLRIVDSDAAARRRFAPAIRRCNPVLAVPTVDALTTEQRLALAHFINAHLRLRGSLHWRTAFYECTRRGHFSPYAPVAEAMHLMQLAQDFGPLIGCYFRTADVQRAALGVVTSCAAPP
jgi:hypothetical protein